MSDPIPVPVAQPRPHPFNPGWLSFGLALLITVSGALITIGATNRDMEDNREWRRGMDEWRKGIEVWRSQRDVADAELRKDVKYAVLQLEQLVKTVDELSDYMMQPQEPPRTTPARYRRSLR